MVTKTYGFTKLDKNSLPIVLKMAKEIILTNYISFLDKDSIVNFINSNQCDREILDNIENCEIIKLKNICIGFSITIENKIHLIMIDRKYQNQGYGTILLKYTENKLFEKYNEIELQTFEKNSAANSFYNKNGWEKTEETSMDGMVLYKYKKWKK
jgi:GNAT superfamily N-acetyltransferase